MLGFIHKPNLVNILTNTYFYNDKFIFNVNSYKTAHELYKKLAFNFHLKKCDLYGQKFFISDIPFFVVVELTGKCKLRVEEYGSYNSIRNYNDYYVENYIKIFFFKIIYI